MIILLWVVLGAIAGSIASLVMKSSNGLFENILLGIIGGFIGGMVMSFFGQPGVTGFNFYSIVVAVIGAVVLIFVMRLVRN